MEMVVTIFLRMGNAGFISSTVTGVQGFRRLGCFGFALRFGIWCFFEGAKPSHAPKGASPRIFPEYQLSAETFSRVTTYSLHCSSFLAL